MGRPHTERLGEAIADVLKAADLSQTELARRLRARGHKVDQSRVSRWVRGVDMPNDILIYPAIEREAGVRLGMIFRLAGFVEDTDGDVIAAINEDRALDERGRRLMTGLYSELRRSVSSANSLENEPSAAKTPSI